MTCDTCLHVDPLFADPASGEYQVIAGSAAIDAGDPGTDPGFFPGGPGNPVDLAENPRIQNGVIDIGAYEGASDLLFRDGFES